MHLTPQQVQALGEVTALLASGAPPQKVREQLAEPMVRLLRAQFFASCVFDANSLRFSTAAALNMDPAHIKAWDEHFQFLDPVTSKMMAIGHAMPVSAVIPQKDLISSDFFNDFLSLDGLYWGINVYAYQHGRCVGDMRIWRTKEEEDFTKEDAILLDMLAPAFANAVGREAVRVDLRLASTEEQRRQCVKLRFNLSDRESEVVVLVAQGRPDKEVAKRLGIGVTTVRYHLQHAYEKAGVVGRGRLTNVVSSLM